MVECQRSIGPHVDAGVIGAAGHHPIPHFHTRFINVCDFKMARSKTVGICGIKCCMMHTDFCLHDRIQLGKKTSLVFLSAFEFVKMFATFLVKLSRL